MSSPQSKFLGKLPAKLDPRVPALRAVLAPTLSAPAQDEWWSQVPEWGTLANDQVGDCVPAAILHQIQQRRAYGPGPWTPTDRDAIDLYSAWTGYAPGRPETDRGTLLSAALQIWLTTGVPTGPDQDLLSAFASVNWQSPSQLCSAIHWCGGVLLGFNLPTEWMDSEYLWDLPLAPDLAGGHCVLACGYTPTALGIEFDVISWGKRFRLTSRALALFGDEAYAILDWDWLDSDGINPAGVNRPEAELAMNQIRSTPIV